MPSSRSRRVDPHASLHLDRLFRFFSGNLWSVPRLACTFYFAPFPRALRSFASFRNGLPLFLLQRYGPWFSLVLCEVDDRAIQTMGSVGALALADVGFCDSIAVESRSATIYWHSFSESGTGRRFIEQHGLLNRWVSSSRRIGRLTQRLLTAVET